MFVLCLSIRGQDELLCSLRVCQYVVKITIVFVVCLSIRDQDELLCSFVSVNTWSR